jgi:hypothetical protein
MKRHFHIFFPLSGVLPETQLLWVADSSDVTPKVADKSEQNRTEQNRTDKTYLPPFLRRRIPPAALPSLSMSIALANHQFLYQNSIAFKLLRLYLYEIYLFFNSCPIDFGAGSK